MQITLYALSTPIIWVTYYLFKDYIIEKYCENKQKPSCAGKCHMMKVEKENPKDQDTPKIEVRTPEMFPFLVAEFFPGIKNIDEILTAFIINDEDETNGFSPDILKPPKQKFLS